MKKILLAAAFIIAVMIGSCGGTAEVKKTGSSIIAEKYAPESSVALLKFSAAEKFFTAFGVSPDKIFNEPAPSDRSEIIEVLGFDPMNLEEYKKAGLATDKEFGIVLSGLVINGEVLEKTSADIDILFPLTPGSGAYALIKEKINSSKNETTVVTEENGMLYIKKAGEEDVVVTVKADDDYLNVHFSLNSQNDAGSVFAARAKLASTAHYRETAAEINMGSDIAAYFDFKTFIAKNEQSLKDLSLNPAFGDPQIRSLDQLKYYRGAGASTDLGLSDFVIDMAAFVDKEAPFKKMIENVKMDRAAVLGMDKNPALLLCVLLNAQEYLAFLLENLPPENKESFDATVAEVKNQTGLDLKTEVIDQLDGSVNFGMFDGATINMMNYNTVLNFNVKDPVSFITSVEKIGPLANMTKVEPEQAFSGIDLPVGVKIYSINIQAMLAYLVIDGSSISICTSKDIAQSVMNKKAVSFTKKLDPELKKSLEEDQNYLYIDIGETYTAGKAIYQFFTSMTGGESVLDARADALVAKFKYLYAGGNFKDEKADSRFIIKTSFDKPFFQALSEETAKFRQ